MRERCLLKGTLGKDPLTPVRVAAVGLSGPSRIRIRVGARVRVRVKVGARVRVRVKVRVQVRGWT